MAEVAQAWVTLAPSARGFGTKTAREIDPQLEKVGKSSGSRFSGVLTGVLSKGLKAGGLAVAATLGTALVKGFGRLSAIDEAEAKLTGLGNSAKTVDKIMANALTSVKGTAFGLGDAATVAAGAVASGIKPGKALTANLKLVADAATIAGVPLNEMGAIFNKVAASGKLQGDVIAQLGDKGIPILQLLGKEIGKTPAEVSKLASQGKIDFKTFSDAMQGGLGGAALKSGNTFKGALANAGAALGRLGAGLLKGLFPIAKKVFGSLTTALDGLTAKVGPFAEKFTAALVGISDILIRGDFTSAFGKAFNIAEDSKIVDYLFRVREGISGIYNLVTKGDFTSAFRTAFKVSEDSAVVNILLNLRTAIGGFVASVLQAGRTVAPVLLSITKALLPLAKIAAVAAIVGLTTALRILGPAVRGAASAIAALSNFVKSNQTTLKVLAAIVGAALLPVLVQMATTLAFNATGLIALTVATAAYNVVTKAMAAGARIAAAAQWLLNVALTANPIGLVIVGLAALGAALYLLWTKSSTFRAIVTGAFNAVRSAAMFVFNFIKSHWPLLVAIITGPIGIAVLLVVKNWAKIRGATVAAFNAVRSVVSGAMSAVRSTISSSISSVVNFFKGLLGRIKGALKGAGSILKSVGGSIVEGLLSGIKSAWGRVTSYLSDKIAGLSSAAKKLLHINSPSKVFAEIGSSIGEGMALGINQSARLPLKAVTDMSGNLTKSVALPSAARFAGSLDGADAYSAGGPFDLSDSSIASLADAILEGATAVASNTVDSQSSYMSQVERMSR